MPKGNWKEGEEVIYKIYLSNGKIYPINEDHGFTVVTGPHGVVIYKVTQVVDIETKASEPVASPLYLFPYTSIILMEISEAPNMVVAQPAIVMPPAQEPVVTVPEPTELLVN